MFVFIGKAFLPLVQPLGFSLLCWMGAVLCLWRGAQRAGRMLALAGIVIVLISACPVTGGWLLGHLEAAYPANTVEATPAADAIVVLGGITAPAIPPRTETDVTGAGVDALLRTCETAMELGIPLIALFPVISSEFKAARRSPEPDRTPA
ncbi:MAG: hypothetical protein R6U10_05030 [Thermoplasmatota archaeon]